MTAHTLHGLISLIENISSYRSDKPTDEQKTEACDYAAALAGQASKVPALSDEQIADLSLQFVGLEPLTDFDYVGFARAVLECGPAKHCRVQEIGLTEDQRASLTSTAKEIPGAAPKTLSAEREVRMLTEREITDCVAASLTGDVRVWDLLQRKCAEVWGLTLSAEPANKEQT
jgi:hypothetical protein